MKIFRTTKFHAVAGPQKKRRTPKSAPRDGKIRSAYFFSGLAMVSRIEVSAMMFLIL